MWSYQFTLHLFVRIFIQHERRIGFAFSMAVHLSESLAFHANYRVNFSVVLQSMDFKRDIFFSTGFLCILFSKICGFIWSSHLFTINNQSRCLFFFYFCKCIRLLSLFLHICMYVLFYFYFMFNGWFMPLSKGQLKYRIHFMVFSFVALVKQLSYRLYVLIYWIFKLKMTLSVSTTYLRWRLFPWNRYWAHFLNSQ